MSSSTPTAFPNLFGVRYPIIQAPMAGITNPKLAAAVSNGGGLGSLGLGSSAVDQARSQIRETRQLTDKPFNVNFFCHEPAHSQEDEIQAWLDYLSPFFIENDADPPSTLEAIYQPFDSNDQMVDLVISEKPAVVSFHFGVPKLETIRSIQSYGGRVLVSVTSLKEGREAELAGVDAVVAQGIEAGGHRGNFNTDIDEAIGLTSLTQLLVSHLDIPVIAAGGVMDGRSIRAILTLGAIGVQLGTAFLLCPEAGTTEGHRMALKSNAVYHTSVTRAISGRPARGITGSFQLKVDPSNSVRIPDYPVAYDAAKQLNAAAKSKNNFEFSPNWAGQSAALCRELPASELVAHLIDELNASEGQVPKFV